MKAASDDHITTTRTVITETGHAAPPGTHGLVLRVIPETDETYIAELAIPQPPHGDDSQLAILRAADFDLA